MSLEVSKSSDEAFSLGKAAQFIGELGGVDVLRQVLDLRESSYNEREVFEPQLLLLTQTSDVNTED